MNYSEHAKFILFMCLLLLIFSVVFHTGNFSCLSGHGPKSENLLGPAASENYPPRIGSAAEVLAAMRADGFLPAEASRVWYAAPEGKGAGKGTLDAPWDLATALAGGNGEAQIKPGDLVWLRGGVYRGSFTATVAGSAPRPIHFRQYPGERAVIDKAGAERETAALSVRGADLWFWDFEVTNSFPDRRRLDPAGETNPWRGSGINIWAARTKYINLVVRDNGHGFGLWNEEGGTEIYGCLIFNNGNNKKEHGVYAHNKTGTQLIRDNLIFNNAGYGLHIYANSPQSSISGFEIEGNAVFNNGALTGGDQVADQILVGGVEGAPAGRILLRENYIYNEPDRPTGKNRGLRLGYEDRRNRDVQVLDNYIVSRVPLRILWWRSVVARGNTIDSAGKSVEIEAPENVDWSQYGLDSNNYLSAGGGPVFAINQKNLDFGAWRENSRFDLGGRVEPAGSAARPAQIFLRLNRYEKKRAQIVIFNRGRLAALPVKLGAFLQSGDEFEVRDAQNYLDKPVLRGVYEGREIVLPLAGAAVAAAVGNVEREPVHTKTDFAVFVVYKLPADAKKNKPPAR
jgi:hypothetical protein